LAAIFIKNKPENEQTNSHRQPYSVTDRQTSMPVVGVRLTSISWWCCWWTDVEQWVTRLVARLSIAPR